MTSAQSSKPLTLKYHGHREMTSKGRCQVRGDEELHSNALETRILNQQSSVGSWRATPWETLQAVERVK